MPAFVLQFFPTDLQKTNGPERVDYPVYFSHYLSLGLPCGERTLANLQSAGVLNRATCHNVTYSPADDLTVYFRFDEEALCFLSRLNKYLLQLATAK